jgi:hypothetical protein
MLLSQTIAEWCLLCWSGVMNEQQLCLQMFKSAETGIIDLVGAQVSLDDFKT